MCPVSQRMAPPKTGPATDCWGSVNTTCPSVVRQLACLVSSPPFPYRAEPISTVPRQVPSCTSEHLHCHRFAQPISLRPHKLLPGDSLWRGQGRRPAGSHCRCHRGSADARSPQRFQCCSLLVVQLLHAGGHVSMVVAGPCRCADGQIRVGSGEVEGDRASRLEDSEERNTYGRAEERR